MKPFSSAPLLALLASLICNGCGGGGMGVNGSGSGNAKGSGVWVWMGGSNTLNQNGIYGTLGVASADNVPGARSNSVTWVDRAGNFWIFGGFGFDSNGTKGQLNDLWRYSAGQWTWMSGSKLQGESGVYGTLGNPDSANVPGSRDSAVGWMDKSGNLWLFGGKGADSAGSNYMLNDLWKYSAGEWTWMGGSNLCCTPGIYGTQGIATPNNLPGPRWSAAAWTDPDGNFWLYGGLGFGPSATSWGAMDDLWEYSQGEWTWVSGAAQPFVGTASYGTQGIASSSNYPGDRNNIASWIDASRNVWFFGGSGLSNFLNDMWTYKSGTWTWIGGSDACCQAGTYGILGSAASGNIPGARDSATTWTDAAGNLWLFGGEGYDSTGLINYQNDALNDLWKYSAGQWAWMSGSNRCCQSGNYGQLGVAASTNAPGARLGGASWTDKSGNLWLFGGTYINGTSVPASSVYFNDLWEWVQSTD